MKKILIAVIGVVLVAAGGIFYACKKESSIDDKQSTSIKQQKYVKISVTWTNKKGVTHEASIAWDGKGHNKDGECVGRGLCNFRGGLRVVESSNNSDAINHNSSIVWSDNEKTFIEVLVNEYIPREDAFTLELDQTSLDKYGNIFTIHKGVYPLNKDLGEKGGYVIPITVDIKNIDYN
jgi:hypothetical protein